MYRGRLRGVEWRYWAECEEDILLYVRNFQRTKHIVT